MKMKFVRAFAFLIFSSISVYTFAAAPTKASDVDRYAELAKNIEIFTSLYRELNSYYVDDVDPNIVMKNAIDGMLERLDPYTEYIPSSEIDEYQFQTTGKYGGIGATISEMNGKVVIRQPYEGSPSQKAGLLPGDEIIEVDGLSTKNKSSEDIRQLLRGQPNTPIQVKVKRAITKEELTFNFNREEINVGNVPYYGFLEDKVGYIKLDQFTENASLNVGNALKDLKASGKLNGLILDLRGNPGGLLHEAVAICNLFIEKGLDVVETRGKVLDVNNKYKTSNKAVDTETPLIVLINGASASASEIVAGVLQDYDRGVVVGQTTFGKGLVQITRPLPYKGRLKITSYKYYIPSGRCIQAIDYSNKNENGEGAVLPDSLRQVFYTKKGRPVKDGSGIDPDIRVDVESYAPITYSLYTKDLFFEYANIYRNQHPQIDTSKVFELSDAEYQKFLDFISDKEYDYTTKTEKMLNDLIETAKTESYYEGISEALKTLEVNMKHDKDSDLSKHKTEIKSLLESEIASRYAYQKGRIRVELKYDTEVAKALQVLKDQNQYTKLLSVSK